MGIEFQRKQHDNKADNNPAFFFDKHFRDVFADVANLAYSTPDITKYDLESSNLFNSPGDPAGIRKPFVELMRYHKFACLWDKELLSALQGVPELLSDLLYAMGQHFSQGHRFKKSLSEKCLGCYQDPEDIFKNDNCFLTLNRCFSCLEKAAAKKTKATK